MRKLLAFTLLALATATTAAGAGGTGTFKRDAPAIYDFTVRFTTPVDGFQIRFEKGTRIVHYVAPRPFVCSSWYTVAGSRVRHRDRLDCKYAHVAANHTLTGWIELNRSLRPRETAALLSTVAGKQKPAGRIRIRG